MDYSVISHDLRQREWRSLTRINRCGHVGRVRLGFEEIPLLTDKEMCAKGKVTRDNRIQANAINFAFIARGPKEIQV